MAGSWELKQQTSVLVCILHTEVTTIAWSFGLRNLIIPGGIQPLSGMPFDHARNQGAQLTLNHGCEWMFFLDSDVIPPRDAIIRLINRRQPIISGLYARRSPPCGLPVMMRGGQWITDYTPGSIVEAEVVGAGCLLIHRTVLEKLAQKPLHPARPWFEWRVDMQHLLPPGEAMSEDYVFCLQARRMGYRILVDTSIVCRHAGFSQATPGKFEPLDVSVHT